MGINTIKYEPEILNLEQLLERVAELQEQEDSKFVVSLSYQTHNRVDTFVVTQRFPTNDIPVVRAQVSGQLVRMREEELEKLGLDDASNPNNQKEISPQMAKVRDFIE